ncbi:MAG: DMT family transporter [Immundisolibacterales bacterium]|nr:DMT family transporter [Immundisolibacterales bacterium]
MRTSYYRTALLLVIASAVFNSANGLIVRSMEAADAWQIVFYRSWFLAGALAAVFVVQVGGRVRAALLDLRPWMLVGSLVIAAVNTCFILAITYTTVANTMFLLSGAPFFAALLGRIVLGEAVARGVWVAMGVALLGMAVMLWDGLGAGTLLGNSLALLAALCFGAFAVILRKGRGINMLPVVVLGAVLGGVNGALMCGGEFAIPLRDVALLFVWGALLSGTVHVIFTWGSRHVPGAELTLLILIEFILSPLWVWLFIDERPSLATLVGGALVLASVASRAVGSLRVRPR